jgi:hypothetical protein
MALNTVAPVLAKDFVALKIDTDRMTGGNAILKQYSAKQQGIPWFVFLDGDGKAIIDSTDPKKGNIGFPASDVEIAWFKVMLEKVARRITRADIEMLQQSLVAFRDVKLPRR